MLKDLRRHLRRHAWLVVAVLLLGLWGFSRQLGQQQTLPGPATSDGGPVASAPAGLPAFLPPEAQPVLAAIARGGPHPYRQDGGVFGNRERLLPQRPHGYYREYTVDTPGSDDRGARRIVTGGGEPGEQLPAEYYYTDDHYRSFRRFTVPAARPPP